jgi:hypothetical protein
MGFEFCPYCGCRLRPKERLQEEDAGDQGDINLRLDRLIRDLDELDAEIAEMVVHEN